MLPAVRGRIIHGHPALEYPVAFLYRPRALVDPGRAFRQRKVAGGIAYAEYRLAAGRRVHGYAEGVSGFQSSASGIFFYGIFPE